jgi:hypothetical protein
MGPVCIFKTTRNTIAQALWCMEKSPEQGGLAEEETAEHNKGQVYTCPLLFCGKAR